ncbi:MAG: DUF917 domain-containing protein [Candidatus Hodarchaeales archaeon]|jgi:DUF917 family protein
MTVRRLTRRATLDLVIGAKILANGGGGDDSKAVKSINTLYDQDKSCKIASLSDFQKDDYLCIIGEVGGGITPADAKIVENLSTVQDEPMAAAVRHLEALLQVDFQAFVATELGPGNSVVPLLVASLMEGKVAIDGDCCGRSKPKISISTTTVAKISISPFAIVNRYGDILIVKRAIDDSRGEVLARAIARISGGHVGVARCPMTVAQAEQAVIPGTLSLAIQLGRSVREANENQQDPLRAIEKSLLDANRVFMGRVKDFSRVEEGGFTSGEIILESTEKPGRELRIFFQNEYLLSWLNGHPFITCPDSLLIVDSHTGFGLTPWENDFEEGRALTVFARDAPEIWHSKAGLRIFGPQVFHSRWSEYKPASSIVRTHHR